MIWSNLAFAIVAGGALWSFISRASRRWAILSFALFISNMMPPFFGDFKNTLIEPLEWMRSQSRILCLGTSFLLLLWPIEGNVFFLKKPTKPFIVFLILQLYLVMIELFRVSNVSLEDIFLRSLADVLFFVLFAMKLPAWINTIDDMKWFFRSVAGSGLIFILISIAQLLGEPKQIIWSGRLLGVAGHPNFASVMFAMTIIFSIWLYQNSDNFLERKLWILSIFFCGAGVIWTGSRTGCLMAAVGIAVYFLSLKKGNVSIGLALLAIVPIVGLSFIPIFSDPISRLLNGENTRGEAWNYLLSQYVENPWFGISRNEIKFSENSYLWIGLSGGIFALFLVFLLLFLVYRQTRLLVKNPNPDFLNIETLLFACMAALFTGSMFEGYLNMTIGYQILLFYSLISFQGRLSFVAEERKVFSFQTPADVLDG